jgi:hypothetical protein
MTEMRVTLNVQTGENNNKIRLNIGVRRKKRKR